MVDSEFRPWLIEVNSSPSMEHSTHVTGKLVPEALRDFGRLVTDYVMAGKSPLDHIGGWSVISNQ